MRTRPAALAAPLLAVALLAACGGGSGGDGVASLAGASGKDGDTTSTTLSDEEREEAMLAWAQCMREQGIDVPDPQVDANGRGSVIIRGSSGDDDDDEGDGGGAGPMDREDFEAARQECGDPPTFGGELTEEDRKEMEERALAFSRCMREHGVEDFPDPDFSGRGPGAGPGTRVERYDDDDDADGSSDGPRARIAGPFGEIDLDDPTSQAAFETCQGEVGFGGPGGRAGGPPTAAAGRSSGS